MKLTVKDYTHQADALIGRLYIDGQFMCYTLEDWETGIEHRVERGGPYKVTIRTEGETHLKYLKLFPKIHKGMIHILVPGRKWILLHIGNFIADTLGCLLVGLTNNTPGKIENSTAAYLRVYPIIIEALLRGEEVTITYEPIK